MRFDADARHAPVRALAPYALACLTLAAAGVLPFRAAADTPKDTTPAVKRAVDASVGAALRGDANAALAALDAVPADEFTGFAAEYRRCMHGRFYRDAPPYLAGGIDDAFAREVLWTYQAYWWHALTAPDTREAQADALLQRLRALVGPAADDAHDFDALESLLSAKLLEHGFHALLGRTAPLRELMLWRSEEVRGYEVALPEGPQQVEVHLLDDFAAWGWSHFARCGMGSNGGWTTDEAIYAVRPRYPDLQAESYRFSLLGHEGQHFADKQRWKLENWELEYRAKLTELTLAQARSQKLLHNFSRAQSDDKDSPHTYANKRLLAALRKQLGGGDGLDLAQVPLRDLQQAARAILLEDTRRRMATPDATGD